MNLIEGSGFFIYPLGILSFLGIAVLFFKALALRKSRIIPPELEEKVMQGSSPAELSSKGNSVLERMIRYHIDHKGDRDKFSAMAGLELNRMERGLVVLEIVVGAAPLLGLLGTVTGLVNVFATVSTETGMPDQSAFVSGIAMALTTTMIGLAIAIPSLVGLNIYQRAIDTYAAQLKALMEKVDSSLEK